MAGPLGPVDARAALPAASTALLGAPTPARAEVASLLARGAQRAQAAPDVGSMTGAAASAQAAPHTVGQAEALGQQFEALLLRQLVEAMNATVPDSGLLGPASGPKTLYKDMITDALATQIARSGGLGIARLLAPTMDGAAGGVTGVGVDVLERVAHDGPQARIPAIQAPVPGSVGEK